MAGPIHHAGSPSDADSACQIGKSYPDQIRMSAVQSVCAARYTEGASLAAAAENFVRRRIGIDGYSEGHAFLAAGLRQSIGTLAEIKRGVTAS